MRLYGLQFAAIANSQKIIETNSLNTLQACYYLFAVLLEKFSCCGYVA